MNKRIQELMIEAGKTIPGNKHIDADFCNEFAKLLEREFFSAGYQAGKSDGVQETVRDCANFLMDTLDDHFAAEQLQEHFGVE